MERKARCMYYGMTSPKWSESNYGTKPLEPCSAEVLSDEELPFFEKLESREFDRFYCGCRGWE